ncbi:CinA family protein [Halopiger djelfimassiliensis]|uniref:CinA family protein n=1 Tax=Halopiger djelfimassiliensis TaxID=1293047 RepID=UPI000677F35F|nr:CinA family protein [Halopiger djelfimassiliensis]
MIDGIGSDLPKEVGETLRSREETLAVAESCTGGLIGAAITAVPGASDYFDAGVAAYAYDAKRRQLGVSREALDEHGAVSEPVAREMARGVRDVADVTWGVSATGIAGPSGGTEEHPVGTVYVGVAYAGPWGSESSFATVSRYEFDGDRAAVRDETVEQALSDLLAAIDERSDST